MPRPFVPIDKCARFELVYSSENQIIENSIWIHRKTTAWTAANMATMCGKLAVWYGASLTLQQGTHITIQKIIGTDFTSKTTPRVEYVSGLPLLGSHSGDPCPANVTVAVSLHTANRGRSYRGRLYHVGLTTTMVTGSMLASGVNASLAAVYNALLTAVNDTDHELVVASQYGDHAWRINGVTTPVISISIGDELDSQRRRLVGRGQ